MCPRPAALPSPESSLEMQTLASLLPDLLNQELGGGVQLSEFSPALQKILQAENHSVTRWFLFFRFLLRFNFRLTKKLQEQYKGLLDPLSSD